MVNIPTKVLEATDDLRGNHSSSSSSSSSRNGSRRGEFSDPSSVISLPPLGPGYVLSEIPHMSFGEPKIESKPSRTLFHLKNFHSRSVTKPALAGSLSSISEGKETTNPEDGQMAQQMKIKSSIEKQIQHIKRINNVVSGVNIFWEPSRDGSEIVAKAVRSSVIRRCLNLTKTLPSMHTIFEEFPMESIELESTLEAFQLAYAFEIAPMDCNEGFKALPPMGKILAKFPMKSIRLIPSSTLNPFQLIHPLAIATMDDNQGFTALPFILSEKSSNPSNVGDIDFGEYIKRDHEIAQMMNLLIGKLSGPTRMLMHFTNEDHQLAIVSEQTPTIPLNNARKQFCRLWPTFMALRMSILEAGLENINSNLKM